MIEVILGKREMQSNNCTLTDQFSKTNQSNEHTFYKLFIFCAHTNFCLYTFSILWQDVYQQVLLLYILKLLFVDLLDNFELRKNVLFFLYNYVTKGDKNIMLSCQYLVKFAQVLVYM